MWSTKRQTKKHKARARPKRVLFLFYAGVTSICLVLFVYSLTIILHKIPVLSPLAKNITSQKMLSATSGNVSSIEEALKNKKIQYQFVTLLQSTTAATIKDAYVITLPDNAEVIVKQQDLSKQIDSLQLILSRLTMEGKRFLRLDLRFEHPVIVMR